MLFLGYIKNKFATINIMNNIKYPFGRAHPSVTCQVGIIQTDNMGSEITVFASYF